MTETSSTPYETESGRDRWKTVFLWLAVFIVAAGVYGLTAGRTIQWQDSGKTVLRIVTEDLGNDLGLALVHPLYHWLGRGAVAALPIEPAWAVALVSALGAAVGVANVFGCVRTITRRSGGALLAAASLGVAHTYWQMSGTAEVYTVTVALLTAELWCLALFWKKDNGWWWVAACLLNGLGLANHNLALLTIPVLVMSWVLGRKRMNKPWRMGLHGVEFWLLGSLPYGWLVITEMVQSGAVVGTMKSALFGHDFADEVLNASVGMKPLMISGAFTALSFPNLTLIMMVVGLRTALQTWRTKAMGWTLLGAGVIHLAFVVRYNITDQHTFLLPTFAIVALLAGVGYDRLFEGRGRLMVKVAVVLLVLTPVLYGFVPGLARERGVLGSMERHKPYRDDYSYLFDPWTVRETSADRISREAVALAGDDGLIVVEDGMVGFAVKYRQHTEGAALQRVVSERGDEQVSLWAHGGRPVVLVPMRTDIEPKPLEMPGRWEAEGQLYRWAREPTNPIELEAGGF